MAGRRRRGLTGEEQALWERAMRRTRPWRAGGTDAHPVNEVAATSFDLAEGRPPASPAATAPTGSPPSAAAPARTPGGTQFTGIDRRTEQRLRRGRAEVEARLDLHGMTQEAAHGALARFLVDAQARGRHMVLVITGKGGPAGEEREFGAAPRGVLRRTVPHWLAEAALAPLVAGYAEAHPRHGGAGALYVRLRKRKA